MLVISQTRHSASALLEQIRDLIPKLSQSAVAHDREASFPSDSLETLREAGLLTATIPTELDGLGIKEIEGGRYFFELLHLLGFADLALGRIFEAHVNAIELIQRYGNRQQLDTAANAAHAGELFALWVTDPHNNGLQLTPELTLSGEKWFCSASGAASRSLVTAQTADGAQMLFVPVKAPIRVTDRGINLAGMRAAATGSVDFTGMRASKEELIGSPGDYLGEPLFSIGAWRSSAVALGGLAALIDVAKEELSSRGRADQPLQRMRFGQAVIAHETGRLWLSEVTARIARLEGQGEDLVAYVNLARTAVEAACLDAMRLIQRSLGLSAFVQGNPVERITRDLATYLRQPAPDEVLDEAAAYFLHHGGVQL